MSRRVYLSLALAMLCLGTTVWAGPQPLGSPFPLSTCADCPKHAPQVAGAPSGAFMVVWQEASGPAAREETVPGRSFAASGAPRSTEFPLDPSGSSAQSGGAVAADPLGNYVAVWSAEVDGLSDVFAQRYTVRGRALGPAIRVSADDPAAALPADDLLPAVAKSADGGFAVAWVSLQPEGSGEPPHILARRFSPTGAPLGPPVQVDTGKASGERPDVCLDTAGRPVVAWATVDDYRPFEPSRKGVSVRRLSTTAGITGGEIVVSPPTNGEAAAAVSCGPGNTFAVVWQGDQGPLAEDRDEIFAQRFTRANRRLGPAFRVNAGTAGDQAHPRVAYDPTGAFAVVWESRATNGRVGVFTRRFLGNGTPTGPDLAVQFPLSDSLSPEPALAPIGTGGAFLVVWRDGLVGLFGRRFSP